MPAALPSPSLVATRATEDLFILGTHSSYNALAGESLPLQPFRWKGNMALQLVERVPSRVPSGFERKLGLYNTFPRFPIPVLGNPKKQRRFAGRFSRL
jgi:hypothetical protein